MIEAANTKAYLANFGYKNVFWPTCLSENVLTLETSEKLLSFWDKNDRQGWLDWATNNERMINGQRAITPVASRWYNLINIFHETHDDIWFHRDGEYLYWAKSLSGDVSRTEILDKKTNRVSFLLKRPVEPWQNTAKDGRKLIWRSLHPKSHHFLQTEMTYQEIADDRQYRTYALSLIEGPVLQDIHQKPEWLATLGTKSTVKTYSNLEITIYDAIRRIKDTVSRADGRIVQSTAKIKNLEVAENDLLPFLSDLYHQQEGLCALTGLAMVLNNESGHRDFRLSVDRINSDGHYALDNIQLTCQFANFWKSNRNDARFKELIEIIRRSP